MIINHVRLKAVIDTDGAQSALDSWERSGTGGNKKKNQKKKKTKEHVSSFSLCVYFC